MSDPADILLVDDDPGVIAALRRILSGYEGLRFATSGTDALRLARQRVPDLVMLDIEMRDMSGFDVCAAMKDDELLRDVPVIFVTSHDAMEDEIKGLALGAVDFISKPPRGPLVAARVATHLRVKRMSDTLRRAATSDGLTGVGNRRHFDDTLSREWLRAQRSGSPVSLLMADIDCFKAYNDHYGHQAGDDCLRAAADLLRTALRRPADLLARYGGEEFVLLLPDTDAAGAKAVALRVLQAVQAAGLPHAASTVAGHLTLSVGLASYDQSCTAWMACVARTPGGALEGRPPTTDLLTVADIALYAAKRSGRAHACFLNLDDRLAPERCEHLRLESSVELVAGESR